MKKVFLSLSLLSGLAGALMAQEVMPLSTQQDTLAFVNRYLAGLYQSPEHFYYDTSVINFRREALLLARSDDRQMAGNGEVTLGLLDLYAHRESQAMGHFKAALVLDSACFLCYHKLHWIYWYGRNDYGEANRYLKRSIAIFEQKAAAEPGNADLWAQLYELYQLKEGTRPKVMEQRMTAISDKLVGMMPDNPHYWWQNSFHHKNDPRKEEQDLVRAYELQPSEAVYWNALANFYCNHKQEAKMRKVLEDVRRYEESSPQYWYQQKAVYLYRCGKKEEAAKVYKEARAKGFDIVYKH
ncbi:hypothetical protein [Taibaiella chishuiensis]|nr:hypothetical protein [Taibaiella chishuiensis]